MKKALVLLSLAVTILWVSAKDYSVNRPGGQLQDTPKMKQYWLVMLLKGERRDHPKAMADSIQVAHLNNIDRLWKEGVIVMAGPMGYDKDLRGIFIMDAKDSATAAAFVNTDPAVITGRLRFELHPWWTQTGTYTFK